MLHYTAVVLLKINKKYTSSAYISLSYFDLKYALQTNIKANKTVIPLQIIADSKHRSSKIALLFQQIKYFLRIKL